MKRECDISTDKKYRYQLKIIWDDQLRPLMVIGLNPSTADLVNDDPTLRRCVDFARRWTCGGLIMTNLFAYRTPYPEKLKKVDDPIGPKNTFGYLRELAKSAKIVLAAWGNRGTYLDRGNMLLIFIPKLYCLGYTKSGQPRHPLYVPSNQPPIPFGE